MKDMLSIYGTYKVTSRGNNAAGKKFVLWVIGILMVGSFLLRGIVNITGFDTLYSIVGNLMLIGFLLFLLLMAFYVVKGIISWILFNISSFLIGKANRE